VGHEVAREPTYMLSHRNYFIDYAEKYLLDIQEMTSEEFAEMDQFWITKTNNKAYKEYFLNAFGPSLEVGKAGGVTKCDYFVKECADEDPICHEDAVRKHKIIQKYRPENVDIQSEDFNTRLEESGLTVTPNGIQLSVTNQQVMGGATDEEKERVKAAFAEAQNVSQWWAVDKDGDTFTNDTEYAAYLGSPQTFSRPDSISLFGGYDADNDSKISRGEYFNFIENMDCNAETGEVLCTPKPIET
jgi:hypothetical protein